MIEFTPEGKLVRCLPDIPDTARICNIARADNYFVFNALEPIQHTPAKVTSTLSPLPFDWAVSRGGPVDLLRGAPIVDPSLDLNLAESCACRILFH